MEVTIFIVVNAISFYLGMRAGAFSQKEFYVSLCESMLTFVIRDYGLNSQEVAAKMQHNSESIYAEALRRAKQPKE